MAESAQPAAKSMFSAKGKKKPKAMNMNAIEKPPPPEEKPVRQPPAVPSTATEGWERSLRHDQDLLKSCGLWIKEVEADGACLFRAVADQLDSEGSTAHASYRERCVDYLQSHRADFEPFIEEPFDQYCSRMREATTWGGHVEVQALARDQGINVLIYQPSDVGQPEALLTSAIEVITSGDEGRCLQLSFHPSHHHGAHYNSVRCADDAGEGVSPLTSMPEIRRRIEDTLRPKET
eukprot:TRINITY_DN75925_c0_g1_i1.p1 TRINITY_DN75925_c0_g1~~TRINITY_DN75925_c0_g1_i1.p1  ORF type:complete len:269 (+),score=31.05 TRINITY_DN75925_c0_g1_i1:103-807(+)